MITCPACSVSMRQVDTKSHYGIRIVIDQCPQCGALWFEANELFGVDHKTPEKLPKVDSKKLQAHSNIPKVVLRCPEDNSPLTRYRDDTLPDHIIFEYCVTCGGFWVNHAEFVELMDYRSQPKVVRSSTLQDEGLEAQVNLILESNSTVKFHQTISAIAKALVAPARITKRSIFWGLVFGIKTMMFQAAVRTAFEELSTRSDPALESAILKYELEQLKKEAEKNNQK